MDIFIPIVLLVAGFAFILVPAFSVFEDYGWRALGWVVFAIMVEAGIAGYVYDHRAPVISYVLPASNWQCTSTYQARYFNGKIWVTRTECSEYSIRPAT